LGLSLSLRGAELLPVWDANPVGLDGRVYHVSPEGDDAASGEIDAPLASIQAAVDRLQPGDTVLLREGVHTGTDPLAVAQVRAQGTAENWIRIANFPGENPIIQFNSQRGFSLQGVRYLVVEGIEFYGESDLIDFPEAFVHAEGFVHNDEPRIAKYFGVGMKVRSNDAGEHSHHLVIRDCKVHHTAGGGIATERADYLLIENNEIFKTSYYSPWGESAISIWESLNHDNRDDIYRTVIRGNRCYLNDNKVRFWMTKTFSDGNGIILDALRIDQKVINDGYHEPYAGRVLVTENICFENGGRGVNVYESNNIDIVNNTLIHNSQRDNSKHEVELGRTMGSRVVGNVIVPQPHKIAVGGYEFERVVFAQNISANPTEDPLEIDAKQAADGTYFR
jgi:parallel beta-helix repeat protein